MKEFGSGEGGLDVCCCMWVDTWLSRGMPPPPPPQLKFAFFLEWGEGVCL